MNKMFDFIKNNQGSEFISEPEVVEDKSFLQEENDDLNLDAMLDDANVDEPHFDNNDDEGLSLEKWGIDEVKAEDTNIFSENEVEGSNSWLESGNIELAEEETILNGSWLNDDAVEENSGKVGEFTEEDDFPVKTHNFDNTVFEQDMSLDFTKVVEPVRIETDGMDVFDFAGDTLKSEEEIIPKFEAEPEIVEEEFVAESVAEPSWTEEAFSTVPAVEEDALFIPDLEPEIAEYQVEENEEPHLVKDLEANLGYVKWYSGDLSDEYFEISKNANSETIYGYQGKDAIHVNVGSDTYGWNVEFTKGLKMSLRDVKIYQLRQGCLPAEQGVITYGNLRIDFVAIKRITVYETVEYFSY